MGLLDKLLGREKSGALRAESGVLTISDRGVAASLVRPSKPHLGDNDTPVCPSCARTQAEVLITTFGPGANELWFELPVAVDGWACVPCGSLSYPRRMTPEQILRIEAEATEHGREGRFVEAERCFVRVVWDWPGYVIGHVNYADATRERLRHMPESDERGRQRLLQRLREQLELAVAGHAREADPRVANVVAHAQLTLAEVALDSADEPRARRALTECERLPALSEAHRARLTKLRARLSNRGRRG